MTLTDPTGGPEPVGPPLAPAEDWLVTAQLAPGTGGLLGPLYEAAAAGILKLPFCAACEQPVDLEQTVCDRCSGVTRTWLVVSRSGVVHSATTVHRIEAGLVRVSDPYPVIDVELASGHRLILTTTGPTPSAPAIGEAVSIAFRRIGDVCVPAVLTTASRFDHQEVGQ